MPDEEKKMVPIDTSGPDATIDIEEVKDESVVETEAPKQETQRTSKRRNRRKETRRKLRRLQQRCTSSYCEINS